MIVERLRCGRSNIEKEMDYCFYGVLGFCVHLGNGCCLRVWMYDDVIQLKWWIRWMQLKVCNAQLSGTSKYIKKLERYVPAAWYDKSYQTSRAQSLIPRQAPVSLGAGAPSFYMYRNFSENKPQNLIEKVVCKCNWFHFN